MKLSTKGRYAVMAMVDLAATIAMAGRCRSADIAERQEISLSYLEQLFAKLRRGGLVNSVRGPAAATCWHARSRRKPADRRHHPGGGRADPRHALYARSALRLPRQSRAAACHPRSVGGTGQPDLTSTSASVSLEADVVEQRVLGAGELLPSPPGPSAAGAAPAGPDPAGGSGFAE